jgi:D-alanyl-D-alanine carboxypeptidase (penicillin-binding protein 5/6)
MISKLMDYAFATYKSVALYKEGDIVQSNIVVWGGQLTSLNAITADKVSVLVKKGEENKVSKVVDIYQPINAPVERGAQVGVLKVLKDGKPVAEYPLVADRDVLQAGFWTNITKILDTFR